MIEQFCGVLAAIIKSRMSGNTEETLERIDSASKFYLDTDIADFLRYTPDQLIAHFEGGSHYFDAESALICADLLFEVSALAANQNHEANFDPKILKVKEMSLKLYAKAISTDDSLKRPEHANKIEELKAYICSTS